MMEYAVWNLHYLNQIPILEKEQIEVLSYDMFFQWQLETGINYHISNWNQRLQHNI